MSWRKCPGTGPGGTGINWLTDLRKYQVLPISSVTQLRDPGFLTWIYSQCNWRSFHHSVVRKNWWHPTFFWRPRSWLKASLLPCQAMADSPGGVAWILTLGDWETLVGKREVLLLQDIKKEITPKSHWSPISSVAKSLWQRLPYQSPPPESKPFSKAAMSFHWAVSKWPDPMIPSPDPPQRAAWVNQLSKWRQTGAKTASCHLKSTLPFPHSISTFKIRHITILNLEWQFFLTFTATMLNYITEFWWTG